MTGYIIAIIIALVVFGFISKLLKFALKIVAFAAVLLLALALLKNFAPMLF